MNYNRDTDLGQYGTALRPQYPCHCPIENHNDYPEGKYCMICGGLIPRGR